MAKLPWYLRKSSLEMKDGKMYLNLVISPYWVSYIKIKVFFTFILKVCLSKTPVFDRIKKVKS
jgi:hypothetical protein